MAKKNAPRAFDINILFRERIQGPCPRFPVWSYRSDGKPWPMLDRSIGEILSRSAAPVIERWTVFNHVGIAAYLTGTGELRYGFSDMPPEVCNALRAGEMRILQRLAGWTEIRFRFPENTLEFTKGCNGWTYYYDEAGEKIAATSYLGGPIEPVAW